MSSLPGVASSPLPAGEACVRLGGVSGLGGGGEGEGGNGCEEGGGGEGSGRPDDSAMMLGSDCTVMPSAAEAAAALPSLEESEVCTAAVVVEAGTTIVAVMITLAATTWMDTEVALTPALAAIEFWRSEVSE